MAFQVLAVLALICGVAGIALFVLHAFSYVIALALAAIFGLGAILAKALRRASAQHL